MGRFREFMGNVQPRVALAERIEAAMITSSASLTRGPRCRQWKYVFPLFHPQFISTPKEDSMGSQQAYVAYSLVVSIGVLCACGSSNHTGDSTPAGVGGVAATGASSSRGGAVGIGGAAVSGGATSTGGGSGTGGPATGSGRATARGGAPATGGSVGTGGTTPVGGKTGTGGMGGGAGVVSAGGIAAGGAATAGGNSTTGGSKAAGGASTGGNPTTGGPSLTGGTTSAGGSSAKGGNTATGGTSTVACPSGSLCIDFAAIQQEIDGLGASSAGHGVLGTAVLDASFRNDTLTQMGLSIIRVEVDAAGQSAWEQQKTNATAAKSRGAKYVMATPWSPPASMKTNGSTIGGELSTSSYADYAAYLKSFYTFMGGAGAVDVISVQNEPNITVPYTSCHWNATQLYNFVKNNAGAIGVPVMIPEVSYFDTSYSDPVLNDATAAANISYIGMHLYGGQLKPYTLAVQKQKKIWMTEHLFNPEDIGTMLSMAKEIMDCFDNQMNGYLWWYLALPDCNLVNPSGALTNKGYIMGQFSKYIRPGSHRVTATYQPQANVNVQAFAGTNNVIVALNRSPSAASLSMTVTNGSFANVRKYTTSNSKKLRDDGAVAVTNGSFTAPLDAQSVTTFVAVQ